MIRRLPWEDAAGNLLSDDKLRFVCRTWTSEIWEAYLSHIEAKQSEYLSRHYGTLVFKADRSEAIDRYHDEDRSKFLSPKRPIDFESALRILTEQERQIVRAVFYDGLSQTDAAHLMNLSITRTHLVLRRAIKKIREWFH